ncbi:MAG: hypothetical protein Q8O88_00560 [bacterium]|nr:hypothetical protein [bacterium]
MKYRVVIFALVIFLGCELDAQIIPNKVDSLGLKQGMWREFKVPTNLATGDIAILVPEFKSGYYYLAKDKDRKYFPMIECIGEYKNNLKTGKWIAYYGTGMIKSEIMYNEGVPLGECKMFWGNEVLKMEFVIKSGNNISVTYYNVNGDLIVKKLVSKTLMIQEIYEN